LIRIENKNETVADYVNHILFIYDKKNMYIPKWKIIFITLNLYKCMIEIDKNRWFLLHYFNGINSMVIYSSCIIKWETVFASITVLIEPFFGLDWELAWAEQVTKSKTNNKFTL
jgi:hypothetical protein